MNIPQKPNICAVRSAGARRPTTVRLDDWMEPIPEPAITAMIMKKEITSIEKRAASSAMK